ncbi:MAG: 1-deoxy-D-xylulose-5-phosphate reductoisomerase [Candidatus Glassbacteria bacterium]|nr:1-deoxy-D-xylulose-5-phosphate reductoisomerase [Candidatus Glassbacteria bacterium]
MLKKVCILGATGSIGESCLSVIDSLRDRFTVCALSACKKAEKLLAAARACGAGHICLAQADALEGIDPGRLDGLELHLGREALSELAALAEVDIVVNALVGGVGLAPSLRALEEGKRLALANKESLVMAGPRLLGLAASSRTAQIIPVDSEHSALFQLVKDQPEKTLEKVIITASGGPFRGYGRKRLETVSFSDSLNHPTWSMGPKITVDSATLANKGLEVIEAHFLFGLGYENIEVLVHPQSIVHGMAVFNDGTVLGHMGVPDMRIPIQYALTYPERLVGSVPAPDFAAIGSLTFEPVDRESFPCLGLAYEAGMQAGVATAVYNAANEVAVERFSREEIRFTRIADIIEKTLAAAEKIDDPSLEQILQADKWARDFAGRLGA